MSWIDDGGQGDEAVVCEGGDGLCEVSGRHVAGLALGLCEVDSDHGVCPFLEMRRRTSAR